MAFMSVMFKGNNGSGTCNTDVPAGVFAKLRWVQEVFTSISNGTVSVGGGNSYFDLGSLTSTGVITQTSNSDLSDHLYLAIIEVAD